MTPMASDLRYLKLAELYERAYERFIVDVATQATKNAGVRAALMRLGPKANDHGARIAAEMARLSVALHDEDGQALLRALLLDVVDVERAARRFCVETLDRVHDPRVARLFRDLASEEDEHVRIAEDIPARIGGASPNHGHAGAPSSPGLGSRSTTKDDRRPRREGAGAP